MKVEAYLFFNGRCEEALTFYSQALGAKTTALMRFSDSPEPPDKTLPAGWEQKILHANLQVGQSTLMASDGMSEAADSFKGFALSVDPADADEARRVFDALAAGGSVQMPLQKTFWAELFGMLTDRFGVSWMVNLQA